MHEVIVRSRAGETRTSYQCEEWAAIGFGRLVAVSRRCYAVDGLPRVVTQVGASGVVRQRRVNGKELQQARRGLASLRATSRRMAR